MGIIINTAPVFHAQWSLIRQNEEQKICGHIFNFYHYLWAFDKITSSNPRLLSYDHKGYERANRLLDLR